MTVPRLHIAAVLLALVATAPLAAQSPASRQTSAASQQGAPSFTRDSLAFAQRLTQWFYTAQGDSLRQFIPQEDLQRFTPAEISRQLAEVTARAGTETEVIEEKFVKRNGNTQYWRAAKFSNAPEPVLFRWAFNASGQIIGLGFGLLSQAPPIDP